MIQHSRRAKNFWMNTNGLCLILWKPGTVFCWDRCAMAKHYYCHPNESPMWDSPSGGPSRALFFGPAPLNTLDARDNLHLSSWLSGLYCFRRSAACRSIYLCSARKTNICFCVQAGVICNRAVSCFWYLQGTQCKGLPPNEGQHSGRIGI